MDYTAEYLRGAVYIRAAHGGFVLAFNERSAADGAGIGKLKAALGTFFGNAEHLRDNIARLTDSDKVADIDIFLGDKIAVMQSSARDFSTCEHYRLKDSHGGDRARSADIQLDVEKLCILFLGRKFIRHRPFWGLSGIAERFALSKIIYLYNNAVNIERQSIAHLAYLFDTGNDLIGGGNALIIGDSLKAERL